jgi:ADP-ribose pyrophosphatase YjhB (NUDIX family)
MDNSNLPKVYMGIVKNDKGEVLIIQRSKKEQGTGKSLLSWAFPGGKQNIPEETLEEVTEREVLEETGYRVEFEKIISERVHPNFPVYIYYSTCKLLEDNQTSVPKEEEIKEVRWIDPKNIMDFFQSNLDPKVSEFLGV